MKKTLVIFAVLMLMVCMVFTGSVFAQWVPDFEGDKVSHTPHNLRKATVKGMALTDYGEICVYCHTPHNNKTAMEVPLWNRNNSAGPYQMYSSNSLDMNILASPQGVSLACLSCHDGSIALDEIVNRPAATSALTSSGITIENCATTCHVGATPVGPNFEGTFVDTDLRNDHPISIEYDATADPNFVAAVDGKVNGLPLYGANNRVECASCHNPHDNSNRPFLRASNENSALCLKCHDI